MAAAGFFALDFFESFGRVRGRAAARITRSATTVWMRGRGNGTGAPRICLESIYS